MIGSDYSSNDGGISSTQAGQPILSSQWKYTTTVWQTDDDTLAVQGLSILIWQLK